MSDETESIEISRENNEKLDAKQNKKSANRIRNKKQSRRIRAGIITLLVLAILIFGIVLICKSCSADKSIVGTWDYDTVTVYRFEKNGKGALELPNGSYEFSYKIKGDKLTIDFVSDAASDKTYTYYTNDDTLTLIGNYKVGGSYVLKKVQ